MNFEPHNDFDERSRFGSATWANEGEIEQAGLFEPKGPQIGYIDQYPLYLDGDAPLLTIGGAGSGKLRDLLSYVVCGGADGTSGLHGQNALALDPRGELAAISLHTHAAAGGHVYCWNPMGLLGLPQHGCNPLAILKPDSPALHADCKFIAESLIPLSGGAEAKYFELRARDWLESLLKTLVESTGSASLPALHRVLNTIEASLKDWADFAEVMLRSQFESVRRTAGEMLAKQQESQKEFGAVMGELYAYLGFLDDPGLLPWLDREDFSLAHLAEADCPLTVFLNIPAEFLSVWSPLVRLMFTVAMLHKGRRPQAGRVLLLVDEAGQLGRFEALLRAFTFGRGAGIRAWAIFQDIGQIKRNFGADALSGFMGSAQLRQFMGIRDYETARLVSDMLGTQTFRYDDSFEQVSARERKRRIAEHVIQGADPFDQVFEFDDQHRQSRRRRSLARKLLTPEELLALPEDRQILFVSGKNLRPILAHKYPYFTRAEMAGRYLPNPYHPPVDRVRVQGRQGEAWLRVVTEPVPKAFADLPQYRGGVWSYVEGHRPKPGKPAQTPPLKRRQEGRATAWHVLRWGLRSLVTLIRKLIDGPE